MGGSRKDVDIERVSPNDLTTLVTDRGPAPMNIAAILFVDDGERIAHREVTRLLAERLGSVLRLRQRLRRAPPGCGRPYWVDDERFEIERHLHFARIDSEDELMALAARQTCMPLRRDRPLWAAHWVNGIGGGRAALVIVAHHVVADGIGGLAVLGALDDRTSPRSPATLPARPGPPTPAQLAADAWGTRLGGLRRIGPGARLTVAGLRDLGVGGRRPRLSPDTSLNRPTGPRRRLTTVEVPLGRVIEAAHREDCTVNDIVLASVVGAMTDVLEGRGERVDALVVSVPYSSRASTSADQLGNQTGVVPFRVPALGAAPLDRLHRVAVQTRAQRARPRAASAAPLGIAFRTLARVGAFQAFVDHQRLVNTFVTNVRGPSQPLRFDGCPVSRIVPVAVTPGNTAVTFDVLSYAGCLGVTVVADPDVVSDQTVLTHRLRQRLDQLVSNAQ